MDERQTAPRQPNPQRANRHGNGALINLSLVADKFYAADKRYLAAREAGDHDTPSLEVARDEAADILRSQLSVMSDNEAIAIRETLNTYMHATGDAATEARRDLQNALADVGIQIG